MVERPGDPAAFVEDAGGGGEGLKRVYDVDLPNVAGKLVKRFGVKVEPTGILTLDEASKKRGTRWEDLGEGEGDLVQVPSVPVTPEMRSTVSKEGFPMFAIPLAGAAAAASEVERRRREQLKR